MNIQGCYFSPRWKNTGHFIATKFLETRIRGSDVPQKHVWSKFIFSQVFSNNIYLNAHMQKLWPSRAGYSCLYHSDNISTRAKVSKLCTLKCPCQEKRPTLIAQQSNLQLCLSTASSDPGTLHSTKTQFLHLKNDATVQSFSMTKGTDIEHCELQSGAKILSLLCKGRKSRGQRPQ